MTDEVHFTSSCLYYGGAGSLGENREPSRPNEVVYNEDRGGAEQHHPRVCPAGAPARLPCPLQATIVGRSWGHGTTLTSYIRKTGVGNFVSSMSVAQTPSTFAPLTPQYSRLIPF